MPTRIPVVNGIESLPAVLDGAKLTAGTLSGEPEVRAPLLREPLAGVSSISPIDALTCFSRPLSSHDITGV